MHKNKNSADTVYVGGIIFRREYKEGLPKDRCFSIAFRIFAVVCNRIQSASFPIKRGKGDAAAVMATLKIMKKGGATVIFPEATRVKDKRRIQINSGIIRLALQSHVPIVPAYLTGNSVTYGKPISYEEYAEKVQDTQVMQTLADSLMDTIYSLGESK